MKKVLGTSVVIALFLFGCASEEEPTAEEPTEEIEATDGEEATEDEVAEHDPVEDAEESDDSMIGRLTDVEPIPFEDYDETKATYLDFGDVGPLLEDQVFHLEDGFIITYRNDVMRLDENLEMIWVDENSPNLNIMLQIDEEFVFSPNLRSQDSNENSLKVFDLNTGEMPYQIGLVPYEEMSEILIDEEAIYLVMGRIGDPDNDLYADEHTLYAFNKADGSELWALDIPGVRLAGRRPHHYELTQTDDLIYLVEQEDEENQLLVARSKEDGSIEWSETFTESEQTIRHSKTFLTEDTVYVITDDYEILGFDPITGESTITYDYLGEVPGAEVPFPIFDQNLLIWQDVTDTYHHLKVVDLKAGEELWSMDMDENFLVDVEIMEDTIYAFFGAFNNDTEENTWMGRIDVQTGEILDLVDMGEPMSNNYGTYDLTTGLTKFNDTLIFHYDNHVYLFNE